MQPWHLHARSDWPKDSVVSHRCSDQGLVSKPAGSYISDLYPRVRAHLLDSTVNDCSIVELYTFSRISFGEVWHSRYRCARLCVVCLHVRSCCQHASSPAHRSSDQMRPLKTDRSRKTSALRADPISRWSCSQGLDIANLDRAAERPWADSGHWDEHGTTPEYASRRHQG